MKKGRRGAVINPHGTQVLDCLAFTAGVMSMQHCRASGRSAAMEQAQERATLRY